MQQPDLPAARVVFGRRRCLQTRIRVGERLVQQHTRREERADERNEGDLQGRQKAAPVQFLLRCDLPLRQVEAVVVVAVREVVDVVEE